MGPLVTNYAVWEAMASQNTLQEWWGGLWSYGQFSEEDEVNYVGEQVHNHYGAIKSFRTNCQGYLAAGRSC